MKRVSLFLFLAMALVGCDKGNVVNPTPDDPTGDDTATKMVVTGDATDVTAMSAVLRGSVNVDISKCSSVDFGMMYSSDRQEVEDRIGARALGKTLDETDFSVTLSGLTSETKYYYCAFVCLNDKQYKYGAIKSFTTAPAPMSQNAFSVSANKQVSFAPGNLQYQASTDTWRFAEHQYDYIGDANSNISATYTGWIDLFGWGTGNNPTRSSEDYEDYPTFVDWGTNTIGNDAPNTWRTLTIDEWEYLFMHTRWTMAKVNNVLGFMLLPNDKNVAGISVLGDGNMSSNYLEFNESDYANNVYTADQFAEWEAKGAVFLPCAGARFDSDVDGVGSYGFYWSATPDDSDDAGGIFSISAFDGAALDWYDRYYGFSVRLVQDLK